MAEGCVEKGKWVAYFLIGVDSVFSTRIKEAKCIFPLIIGKGLNVEDIYTAVNIELGGQHGKKT